MDKFCNKVYHGNALDLLAALPTASIDAVIFDPMYGTAKNCQYDWGVDPAQGDPDLHWDYHEPIYRECRRLLKPNGVLAWAQGAKFCQHFRRWFGGHRVWTLTRFRQKGMNATWHTWIVQTREQQPIEFPNRDSIVIHEDIGPLRKHHPCTKPVEEMMFLIESLTQPGHIVLDCCCGLGSTLIAAKLLGRKWIGCDLSKKYCQIAMRRLAEVDQLEVAS